jgi:hypothetical protein
MSGTCVQTTCVPACQPGNTCMGTTCMCGNMPQCSSPQTCCPDGCFDLSSDHDHCNGCVGHACAGNQQCVMGVCKKNLGVACQGASECASGYCADGVCCGTACTDACTYCALAAKPGTCVPVPSGNDPHGKCKVNQSTACGTNGQCSAGACAYWPAGTPCIGSSGNKCESDGITLDAWECDGMTTCSIHKVSCDPYICFNDPTGTRSYCASGPCAASSGGIAGCPTKLNNCAPTAMCCIPTIVTNCQTQTFCGHACPL